MATVEEIEMYCRNCALRDFVNGKGLICKRTGDLPAFEGTCENFEKDEVLEKMAPPKPDDFPVTKTREELLAEENLPKGMLYAVGASILGAAAWALISVSTGYQIGYMAIGVGFLVGFAMRQGKGIRPVFGIIGAVLALISCILGDFFSFVGYIAQDYEVSYMEVLLKADYGELASLMLENLASMTALFYGIAVYEGFKLSFRAQNQPEGGQI